MHSEAGIVRVISCTVHAVAPRKKDGHLEDRTHDAKRSSSAARRTLREGKGHQCRKKEAVISYVFGE